MWPVDLHFPAFGKTVAKVQINQTLIGDTGSDVKKSLEKRVIDFLELRLQSSKKLQSHLQLITANPAAKHCRFAVHATQ